MFRNKSKLLLLSGILGIFYIGYLIYRFISGTFAEGIDWELIRGLFTFEQLREVLGGVLVAPYVILVIVGTIAAFLSFFLANKWVAIASGALFFASALLFPQENNFLVLPLIALSLVGAFLLDRIKKKNEFSIFNLQDTEAQFQLDPDAPDTELILPKQTETQTRGEPHMSSQDPGRFRGELFGGFNRRDVLEHMKLLYNALDEKQAEVEALHDRCEELENLCGRLETAGGAYVLPAPPPNASAPPESEPEPEPVTELEPVAEPAPELEPEPIPEPEPQPEPEPEVEPEVEVVEAPPVVLTETEAFLAAEPELAPEEIAALVEEPIPHIELEPAPAPISMPEPTPEPAPQPIYQPAPTPAPVLHPAFYQTPEPMPTPMPQPTFYQPPAPQPAYYQPAPEPIYQPVPEPVQQPEAEPPVKVSPRLATPQIPPTKQAKRVKVYRK